MRNWIVACPQSEEGKKVLTSSFIWCLSSCYPSEYFFFLSPLSCLFSLCYLNLNVSDLKLFFLLLLFPLLLRPKRKARNENKTRAEKEKELEKFRQAATNKNRNKTLKTGRIKRNWRRSWRGVGDVYPFPMFCLWALSSSCGSASDSNCP